MYFDDAVGFVEEAEELERQHYKTLAVVASYPYMKEGDRKQVWNSLSKPSAKRSTSRPKVHYSEGYQKPEVTTDGV